MKARRFFIMLALVLSLLGAAQAVSADGTDGIPTPVVFGSTDGIPTPVVF